MVVSIHAPLARSNETDCANADFVGGFNTCSSCEEQLQAHFLLRNRLPFQYMLLLRGATKRADEYSDAERFQYMLLLRGATYPLY